MRELTPRAKLMSDCFSQFLACSPMPCIRSLQSLSHIRLFSTPWTTAHQASLSITNSGAWKIHVHRVGDATQPSHPLLSPYPPAFHLSQHQSLFTMTSSSHQVPKVLQFQLQHQSFQWIFRWVIFRIDWFDLLTVQGTIKSLLQYHSSKASILQCSAFFMVQLSHPFIPTRKTVTLTRHIFVGKGMSLLFNMLSSRLVIAFLPRSKHLLISWLLSPTAVILEPQN